jgi:hypothetical protein
MTKHPLPFAALALLLMLSLTAFLGGPKLIEAAKPHQIGKTALTVTPSKSWARLGRPGHFHRIAEVWTIDGEPLNTITFFAGLKDDERLFRQPSRSEVQLPKFRSTMAPQELAEFVESSFRILTGSSAFRVTDLKPATVAGAQGFQMDVDYIGQDDELKRKGRIAGAVHDGKLYLIVYQAAAMSFFDRYLAEADAIIKSAVIAPPQPKKTS